MLFAQARFRNSFTYFILSYLFRGRAQEFVIYQHACLIYLIQHLIANPFSWLITFAQNLHCWCFLREKKQCCYVPCVKPLGSHSGGNINLLYWYRCIPVVLDQQHGQNIKHKKLNNTKYNKTQIIIKAARSGGNINRLYWYWCIPVVCTGQTTRRKHKRQNTK